VIRVGAGIVNALNAASSRAVADANGLVTGPNVLAECLRRVLRPGSTARLASVVPWPRVEWVPADLGGVPAGAIATEAVAALRESGWRAHHASPTAAPAVEWDQAVLAGLRTALATAATAGLARAGVVHLLFALLANPDVRTQETLALYHTDRLSLLREVRERSLRERESAPWLPGLTYLALFGATAGTWYARPVTSAIRRTVSRRAQLPPMLYALAAEADRYAVRMGRATVQPLHLVVAVLGLEEQLAATKTDLRPAWRRHSAAALRLYRGLPAGQTGEWLAADLDGPVAEASAGPGATRHEPPWSGPARATLAASARMEGLFRQVGADDLLIAVTESGDQPAARLMSRCGLTPDALIPDPA
jgi:ClpA/ClpB-like protein